MEVIRICYQGYYRCLREFVDEEFVETGVDVSWWIAGHKKEQNNRVMTKAGWKLTHYKVALT
jgi:hypothetical protein